MNLQAIKNLKIILFFLGMTLFYFLDYLLFKKTALNLNITVDFLGTDFPLYTAATSFLKKGVFPLWNPLIMCGTPFFASSIAILSIFNIPSFFFTPITAFMFSLMMQVFSAGIFMFAYLNKGLKIGTNGSLLGAVIFMFSPMFLTTLPHSLGDPTTLLWLPLVFLFYEWAFQKKKIMHALFCGLILSVSFYSSTGYLYAYSCLFLFLYATYRIWRNRKSKDTFYHIYLLIITVSTSLLLSTARLLPMLELVKLSHRGTEHLNEGLFISNLIGIFFPFGSLQIGNVEIGTLQFGYFYYAGTATIILLMIALSYLRKDDFIRLFSVLFLSLVIFLILLRYTSLKLWLSKALPLFGSLALERFCFYYHFLIAGMAALVYEAIEKKKIKSFDLSFIAKVFKILIILYITLLIFVILSWIGMHTFKEQIISISQILFKHLLLGRGPYTHNLDYYFKKFSYIYDQLFMAPFLISIIVSILSRIFSLVLLQKILKGVRKIYLILIFLIAIDLIFVTRIFSNPFTYDYYFIYDSQPKEVSFLKSVKPTERIGIKINHYTRDFDKVDFKLDYDKESADLGPHKLGLNYNIPIAFGANVVGGIEGLHLKRFEEFVGLIHKNDPNYAIRRKAQIYRSTVEFTSINSRLVDLLGMKYIYSLSRLNNPKVKLLFKGKDYYVYENLRVLPRSFFVNNIKIALNKEEMFNMLSDSKFQPSREVILEEYVTDTVGKFNRDNIDNHSSIEIVSYKPNKVVINAFNNTDSFLVLTDAYYPGWQAFIDGKKTKIYTADYIFRGISFPKGRHKVEFIYLPSSLKLGMLISLITLFILISVVGYKVSKGRNVSKK